GLGAVPLARPAGRSRRRGLRRALRAVPEGAAPRRLGRVVSNGAQMMPLLLVLLSSLPQESAQRLRAGQEKVKVRDFDGAIPDFERCLQLQPEEYNASFGLGICFWEKEEYRKARDHFAKVVDLVEKQQPGAALPGVHQKLLGCAILLEDFD